MWTCKLCTDTFSITSVSAYRAFFLLLLLGVCWGRNLYDAWLKTRSLVCSSILEPGGGSPLLGKFLSLAEPPWQRDVQRQVRVVFACMAVLKVWKSFMTSREWLELKLSDSRIYVCTGCRWNWVRKVKWFPDLLSSVPLSCSPTKLWSHKGCSWVWRNPWKHSVSCEFLVHRGL